MAEKRTMGVVEKAVADVQTDRQTGQHFVKELLLTPAHVLPPISTLCATFIESHILKSDKHRYIYIHHRLGFYNVVSLIN